MLKFRRLTAVLFIAFAGCSGGSANLPNPSPPSAIGPGSNAPLNSLSETIALGPNAQTAPLPSVAGIDGSVALSHSDAVDGATLLISAEAGQSNVLPASLRPQAAGTLNVYVAYRFIASKTMTYASSPAFTFKLPAGVATASQDFYIAVTQAATTGALETFRTEGPATVDGQTIAIGPDQTPQKFEAGKPYLFRVYGTPHASRSYAYVVDDHGTSVKAFLETSSGNVAPTRVLGGPATGLTSIADIAVDRQGGLYAANTGSGAGSIRIFASDARGNAAPVRVISGPNTQINLAFAVAVDADGRIYVGEEDPLQAPPETGKLLRFAPTANGNVAPEAVLSAAVIRHIALDSTGKNLILSEEYYEPSVASANIASYARLFKADSSPIYNVGGTGGQPIADDPTDHSYYVYSPPPAYPPFSNYEIVRFDESAVGYFEPTHASMPPVALDTLVPSCSVNGMAVDAIRELVTTGVTGAKCDQPAIDVYNPGANGNVAPIRTISGAQTTLVDPSSVAIGL